MMDLLTVDVGMIIDGGVVVKIMACEVDLKNRFPCEFSSKSSALVLWPSVGRGFSPKATRENGKTCVASNGHKYSHFFLLCQKNLKLSITTVIPSLDRIEFFMLHSRCRRSCCSLIVCGREQQEKFHFSKT